MSTSTDVRPSPDRVRRPDRLAGGLLVLGGVAFVAGGATHPGDSGEGSKVEQLHEMLVDPAWYPSHALLLVAMAALATAVVLLMRSGVLGLRLAPLSAVVATVAVAATVGMTVHLFAALGAEGIAHGEETVLYRMQTWNETLLDPLWALAFTALAVVGGLTRALGNRLTAVLGAVGGLAFALASATIAFTDALDPLFPVSALLGLWAVAVGVLVLSGRAAR